MVPPFEKWSFSGFPKDMDRLSLEYTRRIGDGTTVAFSNREKDLEPTCGIASDE
jgi:hypothetical protein